MFDFPQSNNPDIDINALLAGKQDKLPFAIRFAKISATGDIQNSMGVLAVTRISTGKYQVNFADVGSSDYAVFASTFGVSSDPNVTITAETTNSCVVNIASGDNGTRADTLIDKAFSFILLKSELPLIG